MATRTARFYLIAAAACGLGALAQIVGFEGLRPSAEVEWVVGRGETSIELFMSADTADLVEAFGAIPQPFANSDGMLEVDTFRNGTTELGEWLSTQWSATLNGQPVEIEPMTTMLHPITDPMPFRTLFEAFMSVSVCNVPADQKLIHVDETRTYASFIFYPIDGLGGDLTINLNTDAFDSASMTVRQVTDYDERVQPYAPALTAGRLDFPVPDTPLVPRGLFLILAAIALLLLAKGHSRTARRATRETVG
ncbi:MAG: hypothetical protein AAGA87_05525 [Pseudomonadota bacterium]